MTVGRHWLSKLLEEIKKNPAASNFCFGLILLIFEKIVEVEFACPCTPIWNRLLASAFCVVPALIVFMLMCMIKGRDFKDLWTHVLYVTVPSITWLIIVFLDGRYYTCGQTFWSGKYEIIEGSTSQYWCKPANSTEKLLSQTQGWYAESQFIGFMVALGQTLVYLVCWCSCIKSSTNETEVGSGGDREMEQIQH